jgi:hypothetical protein
MQSKNEESTVWRRRRIEAFAIVTLGDGLIEFLAPKEHSRLWVVGRERAILAAQDGYVRVRLVQVVGSIFFPALASRG